MLVKSYDGGMFVKKKIMDENIFRCIKAYTQYDNG